MRCAARRNWLGVRRSAPINQTTSAGGYAFLCVRPDGHLVSRLPAAPISEGEAHMSKSAVASATFTATSAAHAAALSVRHAELEAKLAQEAMRPLPDVARIAQLKKAKLRIKDAQRA